jgi:uncharacterized protein (DUF488 family)
MPRILTAGYGKDDFEGLAVRLAKCNVDRIIDVRSNPFSKHQEDFRRPRIDHLCQKIGLKYTYLGHQLGGKPSKEELQTEGRPDFEKIKLDPDFRSGLAQVIEWAKNDRVCLLCGCERPMQCHRGTLLAPELIDRGCNVVHIDDEGRMHSQENAEENEHGGQMDLFGG